MSIALFYVFTEIFKTDIKPGNTLFRSSGDCKDIIIADFGLSEVVTENSTNYLRGAMGTLDYMAPERFTKGYGKPMYVTQAIPP